MMSEQTKANPCVVIEARNPLADFFIRLPAKLPLIIRPRLHTARYDLRSGVLARECTGKNIPAFLHCDQVIEIEEED
jgi:hypothetical protein